MSDLREALQKMLIARADHKALSNLTGAQYDAALEAWMVRDAEAARAARAALSAEPAQEMTDEQIDAIKKSLTWWNGSHDMTNHRTFARAVIAADRASRLPAVTECNDKDSPWLVCKTCAARGLCAKSLPEMGEDDWPEMPEPAMEDVPYELWGQNVTHPALYTADQLRAHAAAAVEAYKALVRGKT